MKIVAYAHGLVLAVLMGQAAAAQTVAAAADSSTRPALAAARRPYAQATQAQARLLSGTEYVNYSRPNTVGHQFFQSAIAQPSALAYDGQFFAAVPLLYDLRRDQLVLPDPAHDTNIQLLAEKVQSFTIDGHRFVRLVAADTAARATAPTGFYDLLVAGSGRGASLLARRTKREIQEPAAGRLQFEYQQRDQLFVRQGTTFTPVDNLKSIANLDLAHRAELQKFIRSQRLKFTEGRREEAAATLLRYYNTLAQ